MSETWSPRGFVTNIWTRDGVPTNVWGQKGVGPAPPTPPDNEFFLGMNISGPQGSSVNWPSPAAITYFVSTKGMKKFRLCLGWSKAGGGGQVGIQLTSFADLNPVYLAGLDAVLAVGGALGATFMLNIHEFGGGPDGPLGPTGTTAAAFRDLWQKISARYKNNAYVDSYGLMNEPTTDYDPAILLSCYNAAAIGIRSNGDTKPIIADGTNFASTWQWVSSPNPFNSSSMFAIVDNNFYLDGHQYPDHDGSGRFFVLATEEAASGEAPPGVQVGPNILPIRWAPFVNWAAQHAVRPTINEFATSSDDVQFGGDDNYSGWNQILDNGLAYMQANKVPGYIWGAGDFSVPGYGYNLDPTSTLNNGAKDYTSAGLQTTQWVIIDKYTGFSGPQPLAYRVDLPFDKPTLKYVPTLTVGTPSGNFAVKYNGKITAPRSITLHAKLSDRTTDAGGTITPNPVVLAAGENAIGNFTYTADQAATFVITATNTSGWINPPEIGCSSKTDLFATALNRGGSFCALIRIVPNYIGPAILLARSDGAQLNFSFNNDDGLPRQAIQDWAGTRLIKILRVYSQDGISSHDIIPMSVSQFWTPNTSNPPMLDLVGPDGYPRIVVASGQYMGTQIQSRGQGLLTVLAYLKGTGTILSQENFNDQFRINVGSGFNCAPNGPDSFVGFGSFSGYALLGGTYSNLYATNNQKAYRDGSVINQNNGGQFTFNGASGDGDTWVNGYRYGGQNFSGEWRLLVVTFDELSTTVMGQISTAVALYYSTPLTDTLGALPPQITGMGARGEIAGKSLALFSGVTVADPNSGSPTDSVTLTITGSASGTLTGTGLSGTGPYTLASDTAANITTKLRGLIYTSSASVGAADTVTVAITSSAGTSVSNNSTVITMVAVAPAETPFAAPAGTFTPINKSGPNIIAAQGGYPATTNPFNYVYPRNEEIDYWATTGCGSIRVPLNILRLQPASYGPFDPATRTDELPNAYTTYSAGTQTNLAELKRVADRCRMNNMYVQFEPHQPNIFDTLAGVGRDLGSTDTESLALMTDWWVRFATIFQHYDNVIFELCNEPQADTAAHNQAFWASIVTSIAAITTLQWIFIPTNFFSGANTFVSRGEGTAWTGYTPPVGVKFALVGHQYLNAANDGFTADVVSGKGASALVAMTTACRSLGIKCVLTETGWSPSDAVVSPGTGIPSTEGNAILAYCKANSDVWIGWNYWLGGCYIFEGAFNSIHSVFSAVPDGMRTHPGVPPYTDAPQVAIMQANFI